MSLLSYNIKDVNIVNMWRKNAFVQITGLVLGVFTLSACQPEAQSTPNLKFSAPERILQVREVDRTKLRPEVRLSDNRIIPMTNVGEDSWTGTINVQPNSNISVTGRWIETVDNRDLVLANWLESITVGADGAELNLTTANYNYEIDEDGDSISNLDEREDGTDPFNPDVILPSDDQTDPDGSGEQTDSGSTDDTGTTDTSGNTDGSGTTDETGDTDGTSTNGTGVDPDGTTTVGSTDTAGQTAGDTDEGETDSEATGGDTDGDTGQGTGGSRANVLIPRILPRQAPDIDGLDVQLNRAGALIGEWAQAVQMDDAGEGLWIDRLMLVNSGNQDPAEDGEQLHRWAAMHDGVNLYVLVLSDDVGFRSSDSPQIFRDDALEVFIDGNNSKLAEWGDADDFHFLIALQQEDSDEANDEVANRVVTGPSPKSDMFDFTFSTGPGLGPDGIRRANFEQDVYELAIPIADAGITIGEPFGFELQLDDDDNGGERDTKWGWFHRSRSNDSNVDDTYLIPSVMGTVTLEE